MASRHHRRDALTPPINTAMSTIRKITHILTLLFAGIALLSVPSARAGFGDANGSFTFWTEAGRITHSFTISGGSVDAVPLTQPNGSQCGGTCITGTFSEAGAVNGFRSLTLCDTTTGEVAQFGGSSDGVQIIGSAWSVGLNNPIPKLYFLGDATLATSSIVLSQNGSFYIPTIDSAWEQYSQSYLYTFSAPYDPNLPYRILNLTTGQQSAESASDTTLSAWTWITTPAPLASVTIWLCDVAEAGHWFTIHSRYPDGPEMLTRVQATDGNGNIYVHLTATIGIGMDFAVERDADHLTIGGMHVDMNYAKQDFNTNTYGSFPTTPSRQLSLHPERRD